MVQDFTFPDFDEIVTNMKYNIYLSVSTWRALMLNQQACVFPIHWKIFMFEVMESKVLAILLSTFLVLAFITEKASGIIATLLRLPCKRNKGKNREVKLLQPQLALPLRFSKRRFYRKSETLTLYNKEKQTNKAKPTIRKDKTEKKNYISTKYHLIWSSLFFI